QCLTPRQPRPRRKGSRAGTWSQPGSSLVRSFSRLLALEPHVDRHVLVARHSERDGEVLANRLPRGLAGEGENFGVAGESCRALLGLLRVAAAERDRGVAADEDAFGEVARRRLVE